MMSYRNDTWSETKRYSYIEPENENDYSLMDAIISHLNSLSPFVTVRVACIVSVGVLRLVYYV